LPIRVLEFRNTSAAIGFQSRTYDTWLILQCYKDIRSCWYWDVPTVQGLRKRRLDTRKLTTGNLKFDRDFKSLRSIFLRLLKVVRSSQANSRVSSELKSNFSETFFVSTIKEWQEVFHCWSWLHRIAAAVDEMWPAGWKRLDVCLQMLFRIRRSCLYIVMHFVPDSHSFN
jgi:hypothetical protein